MQRATMGSLEKKPRQARLFAFQSMRAASVYSTLGTSRQFSMRVVTVPVSKAGTFASGLAPAENPTMSSGVPLLPTNRESMTVLA